MAFLMIVRRMLFWAMLCWRLAMARRRVPNIGTFKILGVTTGVKMATSGSSSIMMNLPGVALTADHKKALVVMGGRHQSQSVAPVVFF